ncbi:MAG: thioredoxin family protein [Planctomycetaceae bacterium]|nr:thioredoxin family protein [Planctomycetaceae bacterium]
MDYAARFETGFTYAEFLSRYGSETDRVRWAEFHRQVRLTDEQRALLRSFVREMKVLVLAGAWCGDCVNQCPIFDHFSAEGDRIRIRFFDRDDASDLAEVLQTCGAPRVPAVMFLSEDGYVCGRAGDRTLSKYRQLASTLTGAACSTGVADSLTDAVVQDWLNEFERIQWMLRTSGRLRKLHGD